MKILVLGDCQSNGNNCLSDEIIGDNLPRTWSLRYHNNFSQVFKWYLTQRKKHNIQDPINTENVQSATWAYIRKRELEIAWPSFLRGDITNRSLNGAHFIGYHKRLLQYINSVGLPDRVLVTDYTFSHHVSSFKHNNKQYVFEKNPYYSDAEWNPNDYPVEVHRMLKEKLAFQLAQPREWHIRRHTKAYQLLVKVLKHYNLKWTVVRFGDPEKQNIGVFDKIMGTDIDCIDIFNQYRVNNDEYGTPKLNCQVEIAKRVQNYLDNIEEHS